ncbi:hypothetical protein FRC02_008723 [Tulasnella sp. 418]|nr:hypothetical protein FRC02_008723 [Tulasnella sp. 418]
MSLLNKRAKTGGGGKGGSAGGSKTGGSAGKGYVKVGTYTGSRSASVYGQGGGSPVTIPPGTAFAGRFAGGATRPQIWGSSRYGSGYPYGLAGAYVAYRPFPFGFWPIVYTPYPYYGNDEYGPHYNETRPGGKMHQAQITSNAWGGNSKRHLQGRQANPNATAPYTILADYESVQAVLDAVAQNCSASVTSPTPLNFDDPNSIQPQQMLQFYRASSFGLALNSYNNSANLVSNQPASNDSQVTDVQDTPLPVGTDLNFLACINATIGESVPIMDAVDSGAMVAASFHAQASFLPLALLWFVIFCFKSM